MGRDERKPKGTILLYEEIAAVPSSENGERMTDAVAYNATIVAAYEKADMLPYTGTTLYVRDTVALKLARINKTLTHQGFRLKIVYGYRHPEVQKNYFERQRARLQELYPDLSPKTLDSLTHNLSSVPLVAGHPTGGAVDVTLVDMSGNVLEMGTRIADFSDPEKIKTFGKGVSPTELQNRLILHDAFLKDGFAPFYGEWWHFSYGDREWACFYNKRSSLYSPLDFRK